MARLRMPHGKYQGRFVDELPRDYLNFLMSTWDGQRFPGLIREIERVLSEDEEATDDGDDRKAETKANGDRWDYGAYLKRRMQAGSWSPHFRDFLLVMTHREAAVVEHLLCLGRARADEDGWVLATADFLETGLQLDTESQEKIFRSLKSKGVVEVEHHGRTRYVRVSTRRIEKLIAKATVKARPA